MTVATLLHPSSSSTTTTTTSSSSSHSTVRLKIHKTPPSSSPRSQIPAKRMASSASTAPSAPAKSRPSLSIDLSNLPPLSQPSPPSNTLIITELHNILLFQPSSLAAIRQAITSIAQLNSFSPLPSFRRIVCSFLSTQDAVAVRQHLERTTTVFGEAGVRSRVYFGEHTPIESAEVAKRRKLLEAPHAQKLFFISPPPSPPHGWVMRKEDPPNKEVHATDLAEALSRLGTTGEASGATQSEINSNNDRPPSPLSDKEPSPVVARMGSWPAGSGSSASAGRSRSSTLIYHPSNHGGSPNLPAVMVEDTSILGTDSDLDMIDPSPVDGESERKILAHTARPPVELM